MGKQWYSLDKILKENATYNIIIGKRSNGKSYSVLYRILQRYIDLGEKGAIIRRWGEDFRGAAGQGVFGGIVANGVVSKMTNGEYDSIVMYREGWYLALRDDKLNKNVLAPEPFCYKFALGMSEHYKSNNYPAVRTILFDEFITRSAYLPDEFVLFMNMISTIARDRGDISIFMLANTVNKYCPYFDEMNLTGVFEQEQGTIQTYKYVRNKDLKVAVEYCADGKTSRTRHDSDKYFGFDNPKLSMITEGAWEIANYPHCPMKFKPMHVQFRYYIIFNRVTLQAEIVNIDDVWFTMIHPWTTGIPNELTDIVYTPDFSPRYNYRRKITKPLDGIGKCIAWFFQNDKVFFSSNEVGEVVRNYLIWCTSDKGIK